MSLKKIVRWFGYGAMALATLTAVVAAAGLGWRAVAQWRNAHSRAISSTQGIDELTKVRIGGIDQWIHIRGENVANPILLYVHGGPGTPMMPYERHFQTPLERDFTVVQWDQRGAGKTYVSNGGDRVAPTLTFEQMKADAHELTAYLKARFHQPKIFILGHSWGSMLGLPVALERPDDYYAFVGVGVVINHREGEAVGYQHVLWEARQRGDRDAIRALESIAPYPAPEPEPNAARTMVGGRVFRDYVAKYGHFTTKAKLDSFSEVQRYWLLMALDSPQYGLRDLASFVTAGPHLNAKLNRYVEGHDVRSLGMQTSLPMVFVDGANDWQTPWPLAKRYIDDVSAPYKAFYLIPDMGHAGPVDQPERFAALLRAKVRPLAFGRLPPLDVAPRACKPGPNAPAPDGQILDVLGC